jgi:uncharacterized membrane protein YeaQ/YmgE (transglycosylase-associated protein family)
MNMIGMQFGSFILLLVISVVVSLILHYGLSFYVTPGFGSFLGKVVLGWLGGWLGSPVLGHWGPSLKQDQVFIIPAILGCLALLALAVDAVKSLQAVAAPGTEAARPASVFGATHPSPAGAP